MLARATRDLDGVLDLASGDFDARIAAAFLGPMHAAKTVHCALLCDAAANRLARHTNGRYAGSAADGSEKISRITGALYNGAFPKRTRRAGPCRLPYT